MKELTQNIAAQINDGLWLSEIDLLQRALKNEFGINSTRVGMEVEFSLEHDGKNLAYETNIARFIKALQNSSGEISTEAAGKRRQLDWFGPQDVLMYDLIECDPITRNILEKPEYDDQNMTSGYYDGPGRLEARLKHCPARTLIRNHETFLKELQKKMRKYGLQRQCNIFDRLIRKETRQHGVKSYKISGGFKRHINFSFWKGPKNVMDVECEEHMQAGKYASEGVARALYDAYLMLDDPLHLRKGAEPFLGITIDRGGLLRLAKERLEVRMPSFTDYQHPTAVIAFTLAGALYGLRHANDATSMARAKPISRFIFSGENGNGGFLREILNGLRIDEGGNYVVKDAYIGNYLPYICAELGLIERYEVEYERLMDSRTQLIKSGTADEFYAKSFAAAQSLISKIGVDTSHISFPPELAMLEGKISLKGVFPSFCMDDGYSLGSTPTSGQIVGRFLESALFKETLSRGLLSQLAHAAFKTYGPISSLDREMVMTLDKKRPRLVRDTTKLSRAVYSKPVRPNESCQLGLEQKAIC